MYIKVYEVKTGLECLFNLSNADYVFVRAGGLERDVESTDAFYVTSKDRVSEGHAGKTLWTIRFGGMGLRHHIIDPGTAGDRVIDQLKIIRAEAVAAG